MVINIKLSVNISVSFPVSKLMNGKEDRCLITQGYNLENIIQPGQRFRLMSTNSSGHKEIKSGQVRSVDKEKKGVVLKI